MTRRDVLVGAILGGVMTMVLMQSVHLSPARSGDNAADVAAAAIASPILRAGDSSFPRAGRNDPTSAVEKPPPVQTTAPPPLDAAAKAALALPDEHYGGSATCGCGTRPTVVVGVLTENHPTSAERRQVLRETWFKLVTDPCAVVIRFILSVSPGKEPAAELITENIEHQDLLFLPVDKGTRKGYNPGHNNGPSNLLERVQAFMRWTTASCKGVKFVFKSDDDCYVAIDKLKQRIESNEFQEKRLYFGHFLGGMSAKNDKGVPDADNYMKLDKFPKYAGAGYMLSADVANYVGNPGLPMNFHRVEDRGLGVLLNGFNITYLQGRQEFQPWGNCFDNSLWIHHFQKDPALMQRRYERAAAGKSICGEGFAPDTVCHLADKGKAITLKCKQKGQTIKSIPFASLGYQRTSAPGPCKEGPSGLTISRDKCHYDGSQKLVEDACLGKSECTVENDHKKLGIEDPCPSIGWDRRLVATATCA